MRKHFNNRTIQSFVLRKIHVPEFEKATFKINDFHQEFKKSVLFESGFDTIIGSQTPTNRDFEDTFLEQNLIFSMKLGRSDSVRITSREIDIAGRPVEKVRARRKLWSSSRNPIQIGCSGSK